MIAAVLSGYGLAIGAPWLQRATKNATGWLLGLLPLGLFLYFVTLIGPVSAGEILSASYPWIPSLDIALSFRIDGLSLLMALLITGIGTLVFIYTGGYLAGDAMVGRLYAFLLMFMASMLGLVLSNNLLALFVFWELTTVSSYLLIGYKHKYEKARKAALQGVLITGAGGLALLGGFILLGQIGGSNDISVLASNAQTIQQHPLYGATLALVLIGCFTKSAQFPFHFWLPGAMEAPTPVSSYLHSATMVKAGVFLLARLTPVLGGTADWQFWLTLAGTTTLAVGAFLSVLNTDLKRILAYSTVAALGTLVLMLGIGGDDAIKAALAFLLGHALYKGALFMAAGAVDHETGTRDVRLLGGLRREMPITATATMLAALSSAGVPLLFGFVAKELVYKAALVNPILITVAVAANVLMVVSTGLVAYQTFFGKAEGHPPKHAHEAPLTMWLGPVVLASLSLIVGVLPALANGLISAAASATTGKSKTVELYLIPELEGAALTALILSGVTLLLGVGLYVTARRALLGLGDRLNPAFAKVGAERGYFASVDGMLTFARWQTRILQSGYLRFYVKMILVTATVLAGYVLLTRVNFTMPSLTMPLFYEAVLAIIMVVATFVVLRADSRLTAIIALGVVGYGMALIFLFYGGPDLAMTQFAIETLSVVLFILVLYRLPAFLPLNTRGERSRDAIIAISAGALVSVITLAVLAAPTDSRLTPYFAEASFLLANGLNVVNVIIVDFRGVDTFGEIVVLGLAAIGIFALLRQAPVDEDPNCRSDAELAATILKQPQVSEAAVPTEEEGIDVEHSASLPCDPPPVAGPLPGAQVPTVDRDEQMLADMLSGKRQERD
jgi:multicomponent Na+:H+ antiporter subunit A